MQDQHNQNQKSKNLFTQFGPVTPAFNDNRPMDPIYLNKVTNKATVGGIGKLIDVYVDMPNYTSSIAWEKEVFEMFRVLRKALRSNMPYQLDELEHYIVDSIALITMMSQIERQLRFSYYAPKHCPSFEALWNKIGVSPEGYGVQALNELSEYTADNLAGTITNYNTLVKYLKGILRAPKNFGNLIRKLCSELYLSDKDEKNSQYIAIRMSNVIFCNYNRSLEFQGYSNMDIRDITIDDVFKFARNYTKIYGLVSADSQSDRNKMTYLFTEFNFRLYENLTQEVKYDADIMEMLINAYTDAIDEPDWNKEFIRLDKLSKSSDSLMPYLLNGAINEQANSDSNLYVPTFRVTSMQMKVMSSDSLDWGDSLSQGTDFDFSKDFAIVINSNIQSDTIVNVATQGESLNQRFTITEAGNAQLTINIGHTAGYIGNSMYPDDNNGRISVTALGTGTALLYVPIIGLVEPAAPYTRNLIAQKFELTQNALGHLVYTNAGVKFINEANSTGISTMRAALNGESIFLTPSQAAAAHIDETDLQNPVNYFAYGASANVESVNGYFTIDNPSIAETGNTDFIITYSFGVRDYQITVPHSTLQSFRSAFLNNGQQTVTDTVVVDGFNGLVPFMADQLDYHLPMYVRHVTTVIINDDTEGATIEEGSLSLIKENYIPYIYNVEDFNSTLYSMYASLFYDVNFKRKDGNNSKNNDKTDNKKDSQ